MLRRIEAQAASLSQAFQRSFAPPEIPPAAEGREAFYIPGSHEISLAQALDELWKAGIIPSHSNMKDPSLWIPWIRTDEFAEGRVVQVKIPWGKPPVAWSESLHSEGIPLTLRETAILVLCDAIPPNRGFDVVGTAWKPGVAIRKGKRFLRFAITFFRNGGSTELGIRTANLGMPEFGTVSMESA